MINLNCRSVTFQYRPDKRPIFEDISFIVNSSENMLVVGDNGSGKSTLGKLLCGLLEPNSGIVSIAGRRVHHLKPKDRIKLAYYIFQFNRLQFIKSSLADEVVFTRNLVKGSDNLNEFGRFDLPDELSTSPFDLSINEAWRFSLFLSTIVDPLVLFVDELPSHSNHRNIGCLTYVMKLRQASGRITIISCQRELDMAFDRKVTIEVGGNLSV